MSNLNQTNENHNNLSLHHKHNSKLPELKVKRRDENFSPVRRSRYIFNSPVRVNNDDNSNQIHRDNSFRPSITKFKKNDEIFIFSERDLSSIHQKKTKSILKKTTLGNESEIEHKSVKFAFDENNQPLKTIYIMNDKKNEETNDEDIDNGKNNDKVICKCESCFIF